MCRLSPRRSRPAVGEPLTFLSCADEFRASHVFFVIGKTWMAGPSPAMTMKDAFSADSALLARSPL